MNAATTLTNKGGEGRKEIADHTDTTRGGAVAVATMLTVRDGEGKKTKTDIMGEASVATRTVIMADHMTTITLIEKGSDMKGGAEDNGIADFGTLWDGRTRKIQIVTY